jgi:hypothetical protein
MKGLLIRFLSRLAITAFLTLGPAGTATGYAQQQALPAPPATEYTNIPLSNRDLQQNIRHAQVVVLGQIVDFAANRDGYSTTVVVTESYKGSIHPGMQVKALCICHLEAAPDPSTRIGHRVVLFLKGKVSADSWAPANPDFELFFHPELRTRILNLLKANPAQETQP